VKTWRVVLAIAFVAPCLAFAQPPGAGTQLRLRGTVESFDGSTLRMLTADEGEVEFIVAQNVGINGLLRRSLDDIADNAFIGTTATRGADGRWHASEVHIFPEQMRGAGEGHYAWDFPASTMTNAAVSGTVAAGTGRALTLTHVDGETEVVVGPDTAIVELTFADATLLVPDAAIFVLGTVDPTGAFTPFAIIAETDGVKPPM